jgi:hypothetical protein
VANRYAFLDTSHLRFSWRVLARGMPVTAGILAAAAAAAAARSGVERATEDVLGGWMPLQNCSATAGAAAVLTVPYSSQDILNAADERQAAAAAAAVGGASLLTSEDVTLEFKASLTDSCSWAGAGHTIGHTQVPLSHWMPHSHQQQQQQQCQAGDPLTVTTSPTGDITLHGGDDSGGLLVTVSKATGCITAVQQGQQLLLQDMLPCFMRATTDNDRGGSGGSSYAARWAAAGLDRMEVAGEVRHLGCIVDLSVGNRSLYVRKRVYRSGQGQQLCVPVFYEGNDGP